MSLLVAIVIKDTLHKKFNKNVSGGHVCEKYPTWSWGHTRCINIDSHKAAYLFGLLVHSPLVCWGATETWMALQHIITCMVPVLKPNSGNLATLTFAVGPPHGSPRVSSLFSLGTIFLLLPAAPVIVEFPPLAKDEVSTFFKYFTYGTKWKMHFVHLCGWCHLAATDLGVRRWGSAPDWECSHLSYFSDTEILILEAYRAL